MMLADDIDNPHALIADMGFACFVDHNQGTDIPLGTPLYKAPELNVKKPKYSYKVDIWAIGVIAYVLLTGE